MPHKGKERMEVGEVEEEGEVGDNDSAPARAMVMAPGSNSKTLKRLRRKTARVPSVASSSVVSASMRSTSGFRLKHAFLVGRRGGPSTPVPSWKVYDSPIPVTIEQQQQHHHHHQLAGQRVSVSARKLAASLWELQELPFSRGGPNRTREREQQEHQHNNNNASPNNKRSMLHGQFFSPASSRVSKGSHRRASMQTKFGEGGKKQQTNARFLERHRVQQTVPITADAPKAEIDAAGRATVTPINSVVGIKAISSNLGCGPTTTSELLKVLNHVWSLEEQHASSVSLVGALRAELDQAHSQLQELFLTEKAHCKEVENITKRMIEERALWRQQQEESVRVAVQSAAQEVEDLRKSKRKLEVLHKRVAKDLQDVKRRLGRALQDLERERKARETMEDVCDELAREIGEDKARVEELKRESVKVREEVEEERKMLQMAEIWREERVQMKLMEAKLEMEEKNAALDKLRSELEAFLKAKRAGDFKDEANVASGDARQDLHRCSLDGIVCRNLADSFHPNEHTVLLSGRNSVDSVHDNLVKCSAVRGGPDGDGSDDDDDDDLHSIELNNESFVRPGSSQWGQHSFQLHEVEYKGRRSVDQRASTGDKSQQWLSGRSQGLERSRNSQMGLEGRGEVGAERDGNWDYLQDSQWIECGIEGGEMREWSGNQQREGREESNDLWQSNHENSQGLISFSPKVMGRNSQGQPESMTRAGGSSGPLYEESAKSGGNSDCWQHQISERNNLHANSVFGAMHQHSNMMSSPTRQWSHNWPSPDLGSKFSSETSRGLRDNSLKAKLLEAKLESQQARHNGGKGF